jgi:TetR/AcrR family tetracycline transcriptional repressor
MALHREDVIRAAVELLDEVGLDRLTTRALTTRLGVRPGALYWHVRSKGELLAAIASEIMREVYDIEAAPEGDAGESAAWAEQTTAFAHRLRRALLAHRDGARVVIGHLPLSGAAVEVAEQGLATMRAAGFALDQAAYFGDTVTSYVTGFVLQEQAVPSAVPSAAATAPLMETEPARYPNLREWQEHRPESRDQAFAAGLAIIVSGMRVACQPGTTAATGKLPTVT